MRQRAKIDDNHGDLREVARKMGVSWFDTHQVGNGFGDAVIGLCGLNVLIEIKDGSKPPSKRALTPMEIDFHSSWLGRIEVVESEQELIDLINSIRGSRGVRN